MEKGHIYSYVTRLQVSKFDTFRFGLTILLGTTRGRD